MDNVQKWMSSTLKPLSKGHDSSWQSTIFLFFIHQFIDYHVCLQTLHDSWQNHVMKMGNYKQI